MHVIKNQTTTTEHVVELSREDIIDFLRICRTDVPSDATVIVAVPGGEDWSNMELEIDNNSKIRVEWSTTAHKKGK